MLRITESATVKLTEYFQDKAVTPLRIFYNAGGWGPPSLALALDEPKDTDERLTVDGFQYLVDKELYAMAQPITIDFTPMGFHVTGNLHTTESAGGCGTCG